LKGITKKFQIQETEIQNPQLRSVPYIYDEAEAKSLGIFFKVFNPIEHKWPKEPMMVHVAVLKLTVEWYCSLHASHPNLVKFANQVGYLSITEKGFNDKYSGIAKYAKQARFSTVWRMPTEWDFPYETQCGSSWIEFKKFLKEPISIINPEIIIPPELLFPWLDEKPKALEILEEGFDPSPRLDTSIIKEILAKLIQPPKLIPTMVDFLMQQTGTNSVCTSKNIEQAKKEHAKGNKITTYKYVGVTQWADKGFPRQSPLGVRTPVWKRPSEYRDAVTLNPWTLFQTWEVNSYLKHMISHLPQVGDYTDQNDLLKFTLDKNASFFIMTDWKKSGLTLPHWFVSMVIDEMELKAGKRFEYPRKGWDILDRETGKVFTPKDYGYSLGMANNICTLFNIVLFEYAKIKDVFDENATMLSFNDDSVIGTNQASYNRWLHICYQSGGYADIHKTWGTEAGTQFCEIYQLSSCQSNLKWISMLHTYINSVTKAVNWDHFRFLISDIYDAIKFEVADVSADLQTNMQLGSMMLELLEVVIANYWGKDIDNSIPPELGGVSIGTRHRTTFSFKKALLLIEEETNVRKVFKMQSYLMMHKDYITNCVPVFRPWKKFPKGPTRDLMEIIGSAGGVNHELTAFGAKAQNKFITDKEYFRLEYWINYSKARQLIDDHPWPKEDFWTWAKKEKWSNYAIPKQFVDEVVENVNIRTMTFAKISKERAKYSLPTMAVDYFLNGTEGKTQFMPFSEINFSGVFDYEVPIDENVKTYKPECDMKLLSQISEFNDPRKAHIDFTYRTGSRIKVMNTVDHKVHNMLELMRKSYTQDHDLYVYNRATWWTKKPLPYFSNWEPFLFDCPISIHEKIILDLLQGIQSDDNMLTSLGKDDLYLIYRQDIESANEKINARRLQINSRKSPLGKDEVLKASKFDPKEFMESAGVEGRYDFWFATIEQMDQKLAEKEEPKPAFWEGLSNPLDDEEDELSIFLKNSNQAAEQSDESEYECSDFDEDAYIAEILDRGGYASDSDG
jgi:hypothetical protein